MLRLSYILNQRLPNNWEVSLKVQWVFSIKHFWIIGIKTWLLVPVDLCFHSQQCGIYTCAYWSTFTAFHQGYILMITTIKVSNYFFFRQWPGVLIKHTSPSIHTDVKHFWKTFQHHPKNLNSQLLNWLPPLIESLSGVIILIKVHSPFLNLYTAGWWKKC